MDNYYHRDFLWINVFLQHPSSAEDTEQGDKRHGYYIGVPGDFHNPLGTHI